MPAAKRTDTDDTLTVVLVETGETVTLNRRTALGLLSLQRATLADPVQEVEEDEPVEKPKPRKRTAKKS